MKRTPDFLTHLVGIPCGIFVTEYQPAQPMRVTGSGMGDADAPEPEEFEFEVLDGGGHRAKWLEAKLNDNDRARIKAEFEDTLNEFL